MTSEPSPATSSTSSELAAQTGTDSPHAPAGVADLRALQTPLRLASIATTERYLAWDDDEIRAAMMSAL